VNRAAAVFAPVSGQVHDLLQHRLERALRERCDDDDLAFSCQDWLGPGCDADQRESDVRRCERRVACARDCNEALSTTCGTTCDDPPPPWEELRTTFGR